MLNKKQLKYYKNLLNEKLEDLLKEVDRTVSGMSDLKENMPDPTDRATLESDRNFTLRIRDRERKLIGKIKDALERIENGTYGICESCEEDISDERLNARPVTTLCIECKKKQEDEEKIKGI
jgi:DnaK suppressor protein